MSAARKVVNKKDLREGGLVRTEVGGTPFRSMIKFATDKQLPLKITMFDSNRNSDNILYKGEFDSWASQNKNFKVVYAVTDDQEASASWNGELGPIDKLMLEKRLTKEVIGNSVFYICGPPGMLKVMQNLLQKEVQISDDRIKIEEFTGY